MAKRQYLAKDLRTAHMGNGIVVFDVSREKNGDYVTVAHISADRKIDFYKVRMSKEQKDFIEKYAQEGDPFISATQDVFVFNDRPQRNEK